MGFFQMHRMNDYSGGKLIAVVPKNSLETFG
jgi:hypothetical protein